MQLKQFERIVELLLETAKEVEDSKKYLKSSVFRKHTELIAELLESIYEEKGLSDVMFRWLMGDKSSLKIVIDANTTIVYPLDTVEDLYKVMSRYYRFQDTTEKYKILNYFPHPLDKEANYGIMRSIQGTEED